MVRMLNFVCVAMMGLSILALYHVSEATRVARMQLDQVQLHIAGARGQIGVLQAEWERVAGPARIQQLAQDQLGMSDATSVQLSSFEQLPRRGENAAPLGGTPLHNASAVMPSQPVAAQPISDNSGM